MLLVGNCEADVHFTTRIWEVELGKPLLITWADANGSVNITLLKTTARGLNEAVEIIGSTYYVPHWASLRTLAHSLLPLDYTEDTFTWTPRSDAGSDGFILRICDGWSVDESPRLLLSSYHLQV